MSPTTAIAFSISKLPTIRTTETVTKDNYTLLKKTDIILKQTRRNMCIDMHDFFY